MSLDCVANRFRLLGPLGRGNMGEVHRAADLLAAESDLGREVAVKLILRGRTGALIDTYADGKAVQRFEREVRIIRRLAPHPQVSPQLAMALIATQSSLVFDYVSRQKKLAVRTKLFVWKQLPVPSPEALVPHTAFLNPRGLELVYTAYDLAHSPEISATQAGHSGGTRSGALRSGPSWMRTSSTCGISREDTEYIPGIVPDSDWWAEEQRDR